MNDIPEMRFDMLKRAEMRWMSMEDAEITVRARLVAELGRENERLREALRATRDWIRYAANSEGGIVAQTIDAALGEPS